MNTKSVILERLRRNASRLKETAPTGEKFDMPDFSNLNPVAYPDTLEKFKETAKKVSGATVEELKESENLMEVIRSLYPEAQIIASHLPEIEAQLNPDTVASGKELMKADVGVIKGEIGVAENGCIWIPQDMKERSVCFASEYLVILLEKNKVVDNMHRAYEIIEQHPEYFETYKFGTFISGPSKTADIESALVYGAQAARGVSVILI